LPQPVPQVCIFQHWRHALHTYFIPQMDNTTSQQ